MSKALNFRDRARVQVFSGRGGDGCVSFRREKYIPKGGPFGGDGGRGGNVFLCAQREVDSLINLYYQPLQRAEHGENGMSKGCHGRNGADLHVPVPCGTQVYDEPTGAFLGEVVREGDILQLARGGRGGLGNMHFATSSHQAPREFTPGGDNEEKTLLFVMKTVADVGLVGFPNAGKSTLLGRLTNAHPKIGAYPFTTLHPVIGTLAYPEDYKSLRIADIPGLIEGAHTGIGLGHDFLRHIERSRFLLFLIDMAGTDERDPATDYKHLRKELELYKPELVAKPHLLLANKMDAPGAAENLKIFRRKTRTKPWPISAATGVGLAEVRAELHRVFFESPPPAME